MVFPFRLLLARRVCFSIMTGLQPAKKTLNFADNKEVFQSEYSQHAILRSALVKIYACIRIFSRMSVRGLLKTNYAHKAPVSL